MLSQRHCQLVSVPQRNQRAKGSVLPARGLFLQADFVRARGLERAGTNESEFITSKGGAFALLRRSKMKIISALAATCLLTLNLASCANTIKGVGRDAANTVTPRGTSFANRHDEVDNFCQTEMLDQRSRS